MTNYNEKQTRVKNGRTIELDGRTIAVYDDKHKLLNKKTFDDSLKAMIVYQTL